MWRCAALAAIVLAGVGTGGCGGSRASGPAWPKLHATETDGGESLAPRQPSAVAAIEAAEDATPPAQATPGPTTPAPARTDRPDRPDPPATPAAREEPPTIEEIFIDIDD